MPPADVDDLPEPGGHSGEEPPQNDQRRGLEAMLAYVRDNVLRMRETLFAKYSQDPDKTRDVSLFSVPLHNRFNGEADVGVLRIVTTRALGVTEIVFTHAYLRDSTQTLTVSPMTYHLDGWSVSPDTMDVDYFSAPANAKLVECRIEYRQHDSDGGAARTHNRLFLLWYQWQGDGTRQRKHLVVARAVFPRELMHMFYPVWLWHSADWLKHVAGHASLQLLEPVETTALMGALNALYAEGVWSQILSERRQRKRVGYVWGEYSDPGNAENWFRVRFVYGLHGIRRITVSRAFWPAAPPDTYWESTDYSDLYGDDVAELSEEDHGGPPELLLYTWSIVRAPDDALRVTYSVRTAAAPERVTERGQLLGAFDAPQHVVRAMQVSVT